MGYNETLAIITQFITELNKADQNTPQKKYLATLRRIDKDIREQHKQASRHLIISIAVGAAISSATFVLGYLMK